jgi:KDO2-lipid IV(A) lauroyltransferase
VAKKKPYRFALYLLLRGVYGLFCLLPRPWALALARLGARLAFAVVLRQRNKTLEHLRLAFGKEKSEAEIAKLAEKVFENLTQTGAEVLQFTKLNAAKLDKIVDAGDAFQVYDRILAQGKGLISVTAHLGNWELLAGVFGMKGYKGGVLARRIYYEPYNAWIVGLRQALKVPTIYRDESSREILKLLAKNEIVGLLPDQDIDSLKGIFVPFFGRPAYTPVAPARLSIASGAPIVPNFLVRVPGDRYKLVMGDVIRPEANASRDEAVKKITEAWMYQFEKVIREYPEQWAWMHHRWKTTPETKGIVISMPDCHPERSEGSEILRPSASE